MTGAPGIVFLEIRPLGRLVRIGGQQLETPILQYKPYLDNGCICSEKFRLN